MKSMTADKHPKDEEWERAFDAVNDLICIIDGDHRIVRINKAAGARVGLTPAEAIGKSCYELFHGTKSPPPGCPLDASLRDGQPHRVESAIEKLGGTFLLSVSPLYSSDGKLIGVAHVAHDITDRKRAEEEILRQNEFLNSVLESLPYPFYVIDAGDCRILMANSASGIGFPPDTTVLDSRTDQPGELCTAKEIFSSVAEVKQTGQPVARESLFLDESGEVRNVELHAYPIFDGEGKVAKVIQYMLDVTDRKRTEELLLQSERLRGIGELATGVAHNFNNLLQMVMGSAQVALNNLELAQFDHARKNLEQILESSRMGAETVRRLQDFAKIRSGNMASEEVKVFDVSDVAEQAAEMTKLWWTASPERERTGINIRLDLERHCLIEGKQNELFEVVVNLLKNAVEAMPEGGDITVVTRRQDAQVVLTVSDAGPGIPQDYLGKVFDPFWSTKGLKGAGMGLSASYGIVVRHGGTIRVESRPGYGAEFTVELPAAEKSSEDSKGPRDAFLDHTLNILAVDDAEPVVTMLKEALESYGQTVFTALSGGEALKIFEDQQVDLVICDLGMPGMTGWDVGKAILEKCRARGVPKIPFILLTGWAGQIDQQDRISASGVDRILEKPLDVIELLTAVQLICASAEA